MQTPDRFWAKVDKSGGCWEWTAARSSRGYGNFTASGRQLGAHRYAYELLVGPIPDGLQLDHLCRNRGCVNPAHLEPVTQAENLARGSRAAQTHCLRGHAFDEANTYWKTDARGYRHRNCRACHALLKRQAA